MNKLLSKLLGTSDTELTIAGGYLTASEISHQPETWAKTYNEFQKESEKISHFFDVAIKEADEIIFTGAGTSSFIGHSLVGALFKRYGIRGSVFATTDIVALPENYFSADHSYLLISFARSGDSPESVATLQMADQLSKKCFHLIITCNRNGALNSYQSANPVQTYTLPEETNDQGLAMTSSYSSMLLMGMLLVLSGRDNGAEVARQLNLSISFAKKIMNEDIDKLREIAQKDFRRAVFLGSGALHGTAMEAALKLQELTGGRVICESDTFLGFRHGPKAVVDKHTLIVYFFSNNLYTRKYEVDLLNSMRENTEPILQVGIGECISCLEALDYQINAPESLQLIDEDIQPLSYILPAQILGFYKSLYFDLKPDTPSASGAISRIVQGVHIYPFSKASAIK